MGEAEMEAMRQRGVLLPISGWDGGHFGLVEPDPELTPVVHKVCGGCCDRDADLGVYIDALIEAGVTSEPNFVEVTCPECIDRMKGEQ